MVVPISIVWVLFFYEMLTRSVPFTGKDSVSICIQHVTKPVPKLPARVSHFQWLVDSLLAKNPDKRFQTGVEVNQAISSYLKDGHPVRFESPSDVKTRISGVTDVPLLSDEYDEVEFLQDPQDEFGLSDNFYVEKPFVAPEAKSRVTSTSWLIIIVVFSILGYLNRDIWFPKLVANMPDSMLQLGQKYGLLEPVEYKPKTISEQGQNNSQLNPEKNSMSSAGHKLPTQQFSSKQSQIIISKVKAQLSVKSITLESFNAAVQQLLQLSNDSKNTSKMEEIKRDINQLSIQQAVKSTQNRNYKEADEWLKIALQLDPANSDILTSRQALVIQKNAYKQAQQQQKEQQLLDEKNNKVNLMLKLAEKAFQEDRLTSPEKKNVLFYLNQAKEIAPNEPRIVQQMEKIKKRYKDLVNTSIKNQQLAKASNYFKKLKSLQNKKGQFLTLENKLIQAKQRYAIKERQQKRKEKIAEDTRIAEQKRQEKLSNPLVKMQIDSNLESANNLILLGYLVSPVGNSALDKYKVVLSIDELDTKAKAGIAKIESIILDNIDRFLRQKNKLKASQWVEKLKILDSNNKKLQEFTQKLNQLESTQ
ncbi:MAG: hypothetical protein Q9M92_13770 [Enterobacterales bacterium]|nr:hypothetical protein [Enterobacterales bacterium]